MRKIILVSYTPLAAGGGVPRWNRDFIAGFPEAEHYSWWDALPFLGGKDLDIPEWSKAQVLGHWLKWSKKVTPDDIVIVDGFWGLGLEDHPHVISVAHGIWSHLTHEDVKAGKQPEFPEHHKIQMYYRQRHLMSGKKIVAVSDFISEQMKLQWKFESTVINNAIDLEKFKPVKKMSSWTDSRLVIHGVTTKNKGFEHIEAVKKALPNDQVMLLDEAAEFLEMDNKYEALANADLVVQPSAYEGNSYFVLETLACDVPIVAYNVGLLHSISRIAKSHGISPCIGSIIDRQHRSPEETAKVAKFILESVSRERSLYNPRQVAELFSIQRFHSEWKKFLEEYERDIR